MKYAMIKEQSHQFTLRLMYRLLSVSVSGYYGWRARAAKKYKANTNSNHQLPVAPNLVQQNFLVHQPNEKWVSDIT